MWLHWQILPLWEDCYAFVKTIESEEIAAAAVKLLQSCPTLWDPKDGSPPGSPVPGILQARTLEWVAISFSNSWKWKVKVKSLSRVRLFVNPWTAAYQAPRPWDFPGKSTGVGCHCLLLNNTLEESIAEELRQNFWKTEWWKSVPQKKYRKNNEKEQRQPLGQHKNTPTVVL